MANWVIREEKKESEQEANWNKDEPDGDEDSDEWENISGWHGKQRRPKWGIRTESGHSPGPAGRIPRFRNKIRQSSYRKSLKPKAEAQKIK